LKWKKILGFVGFIIHIILIIIEVELDLSKLLGLLSGEQASVLSKEMNLNISKKTKQSVIEELLKSVKTQKTLAGSSEKIIYKR